MKFYLVFGFFGIVCSNDYDWWWNELGGDDSQASDYLAATSPFYNWFKTAQKQFDAYGPAKHVGKINRGLLLNPELNLPAHRAFGRDSDFNAGDFYSGAFSFTPQSQKFVAKKIHVDAGLALKVGQVTSMPLGMFVQDDGSILIDMKGRPRGGDASDPCTPNPCTSSSPATPRCVRVNDDTAKCIGPNRMQVSLRWTDPVAGSAPYNLDLIMIPVKTSDGSACPPLVPGVNDGDNAACGVSMSADKETAVQFPLEKEFAELKTLADGSSFKDYTYAVIAQDKTTTSSTYQFEYGKTRLYVFDDLNGSMTAVQSLVVPQGNVINPTDGIYFFFGCLRPSTKKVDTRGAGFYSSLSSTVRNTGKSLNDPGLCEALLTTVPAISPGLFN